MNKPLNICFIGSGAISTAIGNVLSNKEKYKVYMLSVEQEVVDSISNERINKKYFPNILLHPDLKATFDKNVLKKLTLFSWEFLPMLLSAMLSSTNNCLIRKHWL